MAYCINFDCGEEFPEKRKELGYNTCLECGKKEAIHTARQKSKRIAPLYNKGGYVYLSDDTIENDLHSIGRKL